MEFVLYCLKKGIVVQHMKNPERIYLMLYGDNFFLLVFMKY